MIAVVSAFIAVALMPVQFTQGGQGGVGSGFGGGGAGFGTGGLQGGRMGNFGEEQTYNHILTPGDKTEWPFKVKAGEVLILRAQSTNFDPAIEVQDAAKKKIAENDDEEPGKQDALLLVYFEKEGTYTAHVKNYRSTAGGAYVFTVRRFLTTNLEVDKAIQVTGKNGWGFFHVQAKKGEVLTLETDTNQIDMPMGPDGKAVSWLEVYGGDLDRHFRATQDGGYFIRAYLPGGEDRKIKVVAIRARHHDVSMEAPKPVTEKTRGLDIWKVKAKAGDFLQFEAVANRRVPVRMGAVPADPEGKDDQPAFQVIPNNGKWNRSTTVLFDRDGEYEMMVQPEEALYSMKAVKAWQPWDGVSSFTGDMAIGSTFYYGFDIKPGYIVRIEGEAKTFDMLFEAYDADWNRVFQTDDANISNPAGTLALSTPGRYYLSVRCYGDGGAGPYNVNATPIQPQIIKLGEEKEASLNGPLDGLWTLTVDKPQTLSIRLKSPSGGLAFWDAGSKQLPIRSVMVKPNDWMMFVDIPKAGEYRIWRQFNGRPEKYQLAIQAVAD